MAPAKSKRPKNVPLQQLPRDLLKKGLTRYVDFNEEIADRLFETGKRVASAVEQTPIYPIVEFQQTFSRKAFDYYLKGARALIEAI